MIVTQIIKLFAWTEIENHVKFTRLNSLRGVLLSVLSGNWADEIELPWFIWTSCYNLI